MDTTNIEVSTTVNICQHIISEFGDVSTTRRTTPDDDDDNDVDDPLVTTYCTGNALFYLQLHTI